MFQVSTCRVESDLGLHMTSVLAKKMPLRSADFRRIMRRNTFFNRKSALRSGILFTRTNVPKSCVDLDPTLLYTLILESYSKFVRKNEILALGVCFPQPYSSAGRRFAASRSRLDHYRMIDSVPQK